MVPLFRSSVSCVLSLLVLLSFVTFSNANDTVVDVTDLVQVDQSRMRFDRRTNTSYLDVTITNISDKALVGPIILVVESISNPSISLKNYDTVTGDDKLGVTLVGIGETLESGLSATSKRVVFTNSSRSKFKYSRTIWSASIAETAEKIGTNGGTLIIGDLSSTIKQVELQVPPEAIENETTIYMIIDEQFPAIPYNMSKMTETLDFKPDGTKFSKDALLSFKYSDIDNDGILDGTDFKVKDIRVLHFNEDLSRWDIIENIEWNTNSGSILAKLDSFSRYCISVISNKHIENFSNQSWTKKWTKRSSLITSETENNQWKEENPQSNEWNSSLIDDSKIDNKGYITLKAVADGVVRQGSEIYSNDSFPTEGTFAARMRFSGPTDQGHSSIKAFFTYSTFIENKIEANDEFYYGHLEHDFEIITEDNHPWSFDQEGNKVAATPAITSGTHQKTWSEDLKKLFKVSNRTFSSDNKMLFKNGRWYTLIVSSRKVSIPVYDQLPHIPGSWYSSRYWVVDEDRTAVDLGQTVSKHSDDVKALRAHFNIWWLKPYTVESENGQIRYVYDPRDTKEQKMDIDWFYYSPINSIDSEEEAQTIQYEGSLHDNNDGLIAYFPFDGSTQDHSGNGLYGTQSGGLSYTTGIKGSAASFDGVDDYITVGNAGSLSPGASDFSFSVWVRYTGYSRAGKIFVMSSDATSFTNFIQLNRSYNNTSFNFRPLVTTRSYSLVEQQWMHFVGVKKGTKFLLYQDGILEDDFDNGIPFSFSTSMMWFGARPDGQNFNYFNPVDIDEFRFYNRALSDSEIQQLFQMN